MSPSVYGQIDNFFVKGTQPEELFYHQGYTVRGTFLPPVVHGQRYIFVINGTWPEKIFFSLKVHHQRYIFVTKGTQPKRHFCHQEYTVRATFLSLSVHGQRDIFIANVYIARATMVLLWVYSHSGIFVDKCTQAVQLFCRFLVAKCKALSYLLFVDQFSVNVWKLC